MHAGHEKSRTDRGCQRRAACRRGYLPDPSREPLENGLERGPLSGQKLEVLVFGEEARVGQLLVLQVVRLLEPIGKAGADPA